jgi:hypothetical protein
MKQFIYSAILGTVATSPAAALSSLERMVLEELSCKSAPSPTGVIRELAKAGNISIDKNIGYDSLSCWVLEGEFLIAGMKFGLVCAYEEDEAIRSRNPDLYVRGPGTSPGSTLSFGSSVPAEEMADWYLNIFGPANVSSAIAEEGMTTLGDRSEVSCTSWMQ